MTKKSLARLSHKHAYPGEEIKRLPASPPVRGLGVGKGPGRKTNLPVPREIQDEERLNAILTGVQPGTRVFKMGKAEIFISPPFQVQGWHMSISRLDRYPDWDEVTTAWYTLVPDAPQRFAVMVLPPFAEYIDIHSNVFQVHELRSGLVAGYVVGPFQIGSKVQHADGSEGVVKEDGIEWVQVEVQKGGLNGLITWWPKGLTSRR